MRPGQGVGKQAQETQGDNHQFCSLGVSQEGSRNWVLQDKQEFTKLIMGEGLSGASQMAQW